MKDELLRQLLTFYRLEVIEQAADVSSETFENAVAAGCLVEVPGGFNSDKHDDAGWGAEPGDQWFSDSPEIVGALEAWTEDEGENDGV